MTMAEDFHEYRQSLLKEYGERGKPYTETDIVFIRNLDLKPQLDLNLMVKVLKPSQSISPEAEVTERERLPVLEGLQKYPGQQVLLVGRPGSGKSTTLERLLWKKAKGEGEIPVLVELRSYQNSTLDSIRRFFAHHGLELSEAEIEHLLSERKLFLLFDGLNELPSKEARDEISQFRQQYSQLSAIFTTRELSAGGDLGIQKQLEMEPLTEEQIKEFVSAYLPETGDELLQKLDPRLADIRQTPLFLWILCQVFKELKEVPENAGMLLRYFALQQDKLKEDVTVEQELRDRAPQLLQALAVAMMSKGETKEDLRLEIPLWKAENVLEETLKQLGAKKGANRSKEWLQNLLSYHLIQLEKDGTRELVQFRHQLIQEYYAAEWLKSQLSNLKDDFFQHHYLNYVKWTEAICGSRSGVPPRIALMLNLSEDRDREQILRVVKLALQVDLQLGARLAGEVQKQFQRKTVDLVWGCQVHLFVKIELLKKTKSEKAIGFLSQALKDSDQDVRIRAAYTLGKIGSEGVVEPLINALKDSDDGVRKIAVCALGEIGSSRAVEPLIQVLNSSDLSSIAAANLSKISSERSERQVRNLTTVYNSPDYLVLLKAVEALGKIANEKAVEHLIKLLSNKDIIMAVQACSALGKINSERAVELLINDFKDSESNVRGMVAAILGKIGSERAVEFLINALNDSDNYMRQSAAKALRAIGSERAVEPLMNALRNSDTHGRSCAVEALGKILKEKAFDIIIGALKDSDSSVRECAIEALGELGNDKIFESLINAFRDSDEDVRIKAEEALVKIGNERVVGLLIKALRDTDSYVRYHAVEALGKIGSERAVDSLIKALNDSDKDVRISAAYTLVEMGNEKAVEPLINALNDSDKDVRRDVASALGAIGSEKAVGPLINALNDSDKDVRRDVASALGAIGSEKAVEPLINALNDFDKDVRRDVASALGAIGSEKAVGPLINALNDFDKDVGGYALLALGKIDSERAVDHFINALNDFDKYVRWRGAKALGEIGSEIAVEPLINALSDSDTWVRHHTAKALDKIAYPELLPRLIEFISTRTGTKILNIITAVQERYRYYNYQIYQNPLPPEPSPNPPLSGDTYINIEQLAGGKIKQRDNIRTQNNLK